MTSALCAVIWFFVATGKQVSWLGFFWRSTLLGAVAAVAWIGAENAGNKIEKELERIRTRGRKRLLPQLHNSPTPTRGWGLLVVDSCLQ